MKSRILLTAAVFPFGGLLILKGAVTAAAAREPDGPVPGPRALGR